MDIDKILRTMVGLYQTYPNIFNRIGITEMIPPQILQQGINRYGVGTNPNNQQVIEGQFVNGHYGYNEQAGNYQAYAPQGLAPLGTGINSPFNNPGGFQAEVQRYQQQQGTAHGFNPKALPYTNEAYVSGSGGANSATTPTGGYLAQSMGMNSPYFRNGKFKKPNRQEVVSEIKMYVFGDNDNSITVNQLSDGEDYIRHVCRYGSLFHWLQRHTYDIVYPDTTATVQFYVCTECRTLSYLPDTLA